MASDARGRQTAELTAANSAPFDLLGSSVAILGRTAVAGGAAAIWIFAEPPGGWHNQTQTAQLTSPDFPADLEALSPTTFAAGAGFATVNGNQLQGAIDVYTLASSTTSQPAATHAPGPVPPRRPAPCRSLTTPRLWPAPATRIRCR